MTKDAAPRIGEPAPDFTLKDGAGRDWRLSEQRGRVVVLLFYPGDETPVCTRQMCSVRDRWEDYAATGAEVVGVSTDTAESHQKFAAHHGLPLRLLSDTSGEVSRTYGATSWLPNRAARAVVVVDGAGSSPTQSTTPLAHPPERRRVLAPSAPAHGAPPLLAPPSGV